MSRSFGQPPNLLGPGLRLPANGKPMTIMQLAGFPAKSSVTPQALAENGVVKSAKDSIKVLGTGELDVPLEVAAHKFSRSAREKIEAAGGSVRLIE